MAFWTLYTPSARRTGHDPEAGGPGRNHSPRIANIAPNDAMIMRMTRIQADGIFGEAGPEGSLKT